MSESFRCIVWLFLGNAQAKPVLLKQSHDIRNITPIGTTRGLTIFADLTICSMYGLRCTVLRIKSEKVKLVMLDLNHQHPIKDHGSSKALVPCCYHSSSLAVSHPLAHSFQAAGKGMINDYSSGSPPNSLRLLCSITGESVVRCVRLFPETTGLAVACRSRSWTQNWARNSCP